MRQLNATGQLLSDLDRERDRWETGLFMSSPDQCTMGCNYEVTRPGRRSGHWHRSQATQRSSLMSTFSEPVHHDMRQKQNMLITDAIASSSTSSAFQSRCQSWNKSVGLRCLASTSLNWTQITAFFETFDFKVCKLKLDSTPSCLCIWVNSSKTLTSHWGGGKIPMQITCLQFRNPPDGRFM